MVIKMVKSGVKITPFARLNFLNEARLNKSSGISGKLVGHRDAELERN